MLRTRNLSKWLAVLLMVVFVVGAFVSSPSRYEDLIQAGIFLTMLAGGLFVLYGYLSLIRTTRDGLAPLWLILTFYTKLCTVLAVMAVLTKQVIEGVLGHDVHLMDNVMYGFLAVMAASYVVAGIYLIRGLRSKDILGRRISPWPWSG